MFKIVKTIATDIYTSWTQTFKRYSLIHKNVLVSRRCFVKNTTFHGTAKIDEYCRFIGEPQISIGNNFYANVGCHFLGEISFGKDVMIGPKTVIWGRDHEISKDVPMKSLQHVKSPITIGDNVWIGANVTILKGVNIGNNVVIGAGSVVTKNIENNKVVVGNPAKAIKDL